MRQLPQNKTCFKCQQRLITPKRQVVSSTATANTIAFKESAVTVIQCRCGLNYWRQV